MRHAANPAEVVRVKHLTYKPALFRRRILRCDAAAHESDPVHSLARTGGRGWRSAFRRGGSDAALIP